MSVLQHWIRNLAAVGGLLLPAACSGAEPHPQPPAVPAAPQPEPQAPASLPATPPQLPQAFEDPCPPCGRG